MTTKKIPKYNDRHAYTSVRVVENNMNQGDNQDRFTVIIITDQQNMIAEHGRETRRIEFTITGEWEINDFVDAIRELKYGFD